MLATPSNPTGTSIPFDELASICELARRRGAWRIVDEIYLGLADPTAAAPAMSLLYMTLTLLYASCGGALFLRRFRRA